MSFFKRLPEGLGGAKPIDELAKACPSTLSNRSMASWRIRKKAASDQSVLAYRLEFMVASADAALVVDALRSEFDLENVEVFQEGQARRDKTAVHFSIRAEFGGAVVVILTNSMALLAKIDELNLEPRPPWKVFPEVDPSTLGSLQGSMEYWWDWFFLPFWSAADAPARSRYLQKHPADNEWREFLETHAP
jgi:hypothetical protein